MNGSGQDWDWAGAGLQRLDRLWRLGIGLVWLALGWCGSAAGEPILSRPYWFDQPIEWAGATAPALVETELLQQALRPDKSPDPSGQVTAVEAFIQAYPQSPWTPSLRNNLGQYYREHGQYTLALAQWGKSWEATKAEGDFHSRCLAEYALAQCTRLLAMLGRVADLAGSRNSIIGSRNHHGSCA
jgi:hypothetical protein